LISDGCLPLDEQLARFQAVLRRNRTLTEALARAATLELPSWYLVAGCLYQTVWNVAGGQPPNAGILDYDLAYFDASDLSWAAEDCDGGQDHRSQECLRNAGAPGATVTASRSRARSTSGLNAMTD
jgi:hypothetical protein